MHPLKKKILVIEDDQSTAEILCHLADMLELECVIEREIIPLVEIKRHRPDLILLDYRLSNGLGHLFSHQIKNMPSTKDICIILMSAANQIEKIAKESQADYFISKPFDLDEITQLIFRCLYGTAA